VSRGSTGASSFVSSTGYTEALTSGALIGDYVSGAAVAFGAVGFFSSTTGPLEYEGIVV